MFSQTQHKIERMQEQSGFETVFLLIQSASSEASNFKTQVTNVQYFIIKSPAGQTSNQFNYKMLEGVKFILTKLEQGLSSTNLARAKLLLL